jgi:para-aminobenzoate synthetase component I
LRTRFSISPSEHFEEKLLHFLDQQAFSFCFKGKGWGNQNDFQFEVFAGFGIKTSVDEFNPEGLANLVNDSKDFIVSHLSYDVKNQLEKLQSENQDGIDFQELKYTIPQLVFLKKSSQWKALFHSTDFTEKEIIGFVEAIENTVVEQEYYIGKQQSRLTKQEYLSAMHSLQQHLQRGDIYQANFCQEFYWENTQISAAGLFFKGFSQNPNPFSIFYKIKEKRCISFSPERFIAASGKTLVSQPMKGTAARGANENEDQTQIDFLKSSEKDRRENVMIVDMVRNDLSHFAAKGSVKVPELYRIETYPKVHQMYSTVTAELKDKNQLNDALLKCFPMGSMTGAPKVRAMQIIESLEHTKRGLFSGTIGFFTPNGQADFNVIIRSLLYDEQTHYLSCHVGGGITILSDSEAEYEECLVKFKPIQQLIASIAGD